MKTRVLVLIGLALASAGCSRREPPPEKVVVAPNIAADAAVARIQTMGGSVEFDEAAPGRPVVKVDLHGTAITDADLKVLQSFPELRKLDLRLTKIGDEGVAHAQGLRHLQLVNLFRTGVGDAGLLYLAPNKELDTLLIGGTRVTDEGLAVVAGFPRLKKLSLFETAVGDAGLKHLAGLSQLEVLLVAKSKVTEAGMTEIKRARPKLSFDETI
jgi:hypothetical protein